MLHFRSHETPTLIHPASRTRDMHTPLEDNLRCMGKKFPRNFLESKNLYRAEVFHIIYYCTQITEETKIKEAKIRHISPTETTEGTIFLIPRLYIVFHFSSFLSFIFFPLPSLTTTIYRISSLLKHRVRVSLSHCNQRIHFPKHYVSRSAGHRAEALDHRSLSRRVRTWGFARYPL